MLRRIYKNRYSRSLVRARRWGLSMKFLKWGGKMPSTKRYDLVPNDEYDTRIPLHPEEAFAYGITFQAKYIGTMDVPRPTSRVEIVAAMRRVRYEFKAKGVKKRKVTVDVSTDGVRVLARKKKGKGKKSNSSIFSRKKNTVVEGSEIMHHPIYRIFYVSHDSSDLKIFSYIARDGATNVFKCNVFKSTRKSQAMKIVRTVGQAFEVCHKMQNNPDQPTASTSSVVDDQTPTDIASEVPVSKEATSDCAASESGATSTAKVEESTPEGPAQARPQHLELLPPPPRKETKRAQRTTPAPSINLPDLPECITKVDIESAVAETGETTPLSSQHQLQLLRERLEQQAQQTRAAVAQLLLLRDQLAAEQAARCEAQARTHQLLNHNKELLEHISALVAHLQERERGNSRPISAHQLTLLPQTNGAVTNGAVTNGAVNNSKIENSACNGNNQHNINTEQLIDMIAQNNKLSQNVENNNTRLSPYNSSPNVPASPVDGPTLPPNFAGMTNEQIQTYLISKFHNLGGLNSNEVKSNQNQHFYQNSRAFPNIPLLMNHISSNDIAGLLNHQAYDEHIGIAQMSLGQSDNSLYNSQTTTSKDSTPDAFSSDDSVPFIMPLSHNGTLRATGKDGRVRLIVPVSPSTSSSNIVEIHNPPESTSATLKVPQAGPITRTTSEKVPNRSEMMSALRSQWTRHTTK